MCRSLVDKALSVFLSVESLRSAEVHTLLCQNTVGAMIHTLPGNASNVHTVKLPISTRAAINSDVR